MRNSARFAVAAFVSALTLIVLPVTSADAAQMKPNAVHCCI
jgi:hypothetical protein